MADENIVATDDAPKTEAPTGKAAFAAARQEVRARAQSRDQDSSPEEPSTDDTPSTDTPPAQQPDKPADALPETGPTEDALLTPEEVSKLSAGDRKLYEKAQKNYTQKTQKLAAERKEWEESRKTFDSWKPLIDAFEANPEDTIQRIASERGLKLVKADAQDTQVIESKTAETMAELPAEWQFLTTVLNAFEQRIRQETLAEVRGELKPIKEAHDVALSNAVAAETESNLAAFTAKHPDWKKHEAKMTEMADKFQPAKPMKDTEYLEILYKLVTADLKEADQTAAIVDKINKVVEKAEPAAQSVDSSRVEHVMPKGIDPRHRFREAAKAARQGIRWTVTD
jgi:hypothetical protein